MSRDITQRTPQEQRNLDASLLEAVKVQSFGDGFAPDN